MSLFSSLVKKPLGCAFTILASLFLLVLVIVIVSVIVVDHFAVNIAAHELQQRSGFTLTAGQQDIGLLTGEADLHDLEITNPDRFAAKDFLKINEIAVNVEPLSVLHKRIIVDKFVVDIDSFAMVRNKDGSLNLTALKDGLLGAAPITTGTKTSGNAVPPFTIHSFTLKIKTVKRFDFNSNNGKPQIIEVNYSQTFKDVDETNYPAVAVQIGADLKREGYSSFENALKDELLDPATYFDAMKSIGGEVLDDAGAVLNGAGALFKKIIP
jgi:uncharacterized protein involved in outer membrane biogenesis